jgi:hypothetical protein
LRPLSLLGAIGVLLGWGARCTAAPAASVNDLAAGTIRNLGLQTDLPRFRPLPDWSLDLSDVVLWAIAAAALAALLYVLKDLRWRRTADAGEWSGTSPEAAAGDTGHLARAERYAELGAFVEAMHELLLEGFHEIRERAGERLADSLTSREILRTTVLPEQGQAALRAIVARVEWTYFGRYDATLADYRACRDSFDILHAALRPAAYS